MSKHTPGPWLANMRDRHNVVASIEATNQTSICNVTRFVESHRHKEEANARLIAAAPDLLSACQAAMRILSLWGPNDCDESSHLFEENRALAMMQRGFEEAIAKAVE